MTVTWIIIGATSGMARRFVQLQAEAGHGLILCGRDAADMEATAADAVTRGAAAAEVISLDLRTPESFAPLLERAETVAGVISVAVFAGSMPEQSEIDANPAMIDGVVTDSFTGPAQILTRLAPMLEARGSGTIVGVTSVAGDRGRLGNYVYGAAKAGFATYLSGLRNRLGRSGVHVLTVKPGPVDTAMTWGGPKMPFMTTPDAVARDIQRGILKRRNVIYTAKIWALVMLVIRLIPEPVFKKMSF